MARSLPVENLTTECGVNYQLLAVIYRSSPMRNSQLQSTTTSYGQWRHGQWRHNQLRTLVAPPTLMGSTPERLVYCINRCSLSSTGNRSCNFSMRGNHLAYAATHSKTHLPFPPFETHHDCTDRL